MKGPVPRTFAAGLLVAFAACSTFTTGTGSGPAASPQGQTTSTPTANPADVSFMSGMIHHHAQALEMCRMAPTHGASEALHILCERITVSQTDEIALMRQWLRDHGELTPDPSATGMPMVVEGVEHDMLMPGMLNEEQMAELDQERGQEWDRLFLTGMIQHHAGALVMVDELFAAGGAGVDDLIYKFASDTYADQGSEIGRMQNMLEAIGP